MTERQLRRGMYRDKEREKQTETGTQLDKDLKRWGDIRQTQIQKRKHRRIEQNGLNNG